MDSPEKLAKRVFWTDGRRKGRRVAARTSRSVVDGREDAPAPALDLIVAIATALGCEPWELLVDEQATRRHILEHLLSLDDDERADVDRAGLRRGGHDD